MTAQYQSVLPERNLQDRKKVKAELRKQILKKRNALSQEQRMLWDRQIFEKLVNYDEENPCSAYLCYVNYRSEVKTKDFILWCLENKKTVFVPKVLEDVGFTSAEMEFYQIASLEELKAGYQGIPEPEGLPEKTFSRWIAGIEKDGRMSSTGSFSEQMGETRQKKTPIVRMLLPGSVFDKRGNRIGYGGGFYDRWLAKHCESVAKYDRKNAKQRKYGRQEKIGLAYEMQIVEAIPAESFDQRIDLVITEKNLYHAHRQGE